MWLTNRLMEGIHPHTASEDFMQNISSPSARLLVVSNELGQGVVPGDALTRDFRDAHGRLNIALAQRADLVVQVIAGLPHVLKGTLP